MLRLKPTKLSPLFSKEVRTAEDDLSLIDGSLYPEEEFYIADAVVKRQKEFRAGRLMAKALLEEAGIHHFPLRMDDKRMPLWPKGICGSISHTEGYCGVALAKTDQIRSIGFDIETLGRISNTLWNTIFTPKEIAYLISLHPNDRDNKAALIFSAKECFFKMQFPLTRQWLNFRDVTIQIIGDFSKFEARLNSDSIDTHFKKNDRWEGKFIFWDSYILTGMEYRAVRGRQT